MILTDYSGVAFASAMAACPKPEHFNINLIRHAILNSIRAANRIDDSKMVLCCDGPNSWRKSVFPYYKANRKKNEGISLYFNAINQIKEEIKNNFPYQMIQVEGAEGDDVIAILAQSTVEPNVIVTNDKDLLQLMVIEGTRVYSPLKGEWMKPTRSYVKNKEKIIEELTPEKFLLEHIIKGDRSDGIPNINSPEDVFITGGTQKDAGRTFIDNFNIENVEVETRNRFLTNQKIISLFEIPLEIKNKILDEYSKPHESKNNIFNYCIEHSLKELMGKIEEF